MQQFQARPSKIERILSSKQKQPLMSPTLKSHQVKKFSEKKNSFKSSSPENAIAAKSLNKFKARVGSPELERNKECMLDT